MSNGAQWPNYLYSGGGGGEMAKAAYFWLPLLILTFCTLPDTFKISNSKLQRRKWTTWTMMQILFEYERRVYRAMIPADCIYEFTVGYRNNTSMPRPSQKGLIMGLVFNWTTLSATWEQQQMATLHDKHIAAEWPDCPYHFVNLPNFSVFRKWFQNSAVQFQKYWVCCTYFADAM